MKRQPLSCLPGLLLILGCERGAELAESAPPPAAPAAEQSGIALAGDWDARLDAARLEGERLDASWTRVVQLDTAGIGGGVAPNPEAWDEITVEAVNAGPMHLPLRAGSGPSVLRAQILLDRVLFSPGIIDGHWGKNTEKAVYWFQEREGLRRSGRLDQETFERLLERSGQPGELVRVHRLSESDVEGPFVTIPDDIYEKAELDCLCYESLSEKLSEMFHTSPAVLERLNPGVELNGLAGGDVLNVPAIREPGAAANAAVARLVVSGEGFYVHALDAEDRILFHFPSTLGSSFDPSPNGVHRVTSITPDPWWHYQPALLAHVEDSDPDARIPPGPNNAVGIVWMALSIPHYGIHGTSAPETIGYTTSAGCIRLTNWDVRFLSERLERGVEVEFQGTRG